jgi:hypothetical protein
MQSLRDTLPVLELAKKPKDLFEQVIEHEGAHFIEPTPGIASPRSLDDHYSMQSIAPKTHIPSLHVSPGRPSSRFVISGSAVQLRSSAPQISSKINHLATPADNRLAAYFLTVPDFVPTRFPDTDSPIFNLSNTAPIVSSSGWTYF